MYSHRSRIATSGRSRANGRARPSRTGTDGTSREYLEGSVVVTARLAPSFSFGGPASFESLVVGVEAPNDRADAIDVALDGIIGTDQMRRFDWWFDYDHNRIAVRRNGTR